MAYYKRRIQRKKKSNKTELERFAYNMGKVERGLRNPESRVFESYNNGKTGKTSSKRKPLI